MNYHTSLGSLGKYAFRYKMGGGGGQQQIQASPPPATAQSVEVQDAQRDARKQAAKRKGMTSTVLAGETGGYKPQSAMGTTGQQKSTILAGS